MTLLRDYPDYPFNGPESFATKIKGMGGGDEDANVQRISRADAKLKRIGFIGVETAGHG
jgi:hypothetical protein